MVVQQLIGKPVVYIEGQWIRQLGQGGPSRKKKEWTPHPPPPKKKGGWKTGTNWTNIRQKEREKSSHLESKKNTKMF